MPATLPSPHGRAPSSNRHPRSGFALLESLIAACILTLGMVALSSTIWRVHALSESTQDRRSVNNQMRMVSEEALAISQDALVNAADWATAVTSAFVPGGTPGVRFAVPGLDPIVGAPTVGSIQIITDETMTDLALGVRLGLPRDLDGDGLATNTDVSGTAQVLPVVLTSQWVGGRGTRRAVHGFLLLGM